MSNSDPLFKLYSGFYINEPVGNNAFSHAERAQKNIWVPPLKKGGLKELNVGTEIVFSEIEDDQEKNRVGLKHFNLSQIGSKNIFIFDNHNHAFCFWNWWMLNKKLTPGKTLVHIDQHSDMRQPQHLPENTQKLESIFEYTNKVLNVGNFIQPALKMNLFNRVEIIDSSTAFKKDPPAEYVLDIDMDIFASEMDYIDNHFKLEKIRAYIRQSNFITIATSPFFMDQEKAIELIHALFG